MCHALCISIHINNYIYMSHDLIENRYLVFPIKILILDIIRNMYFTPVNVLIYYYSGARYKIYV